MLLDDCFGQHKGKIGALSERNLKLVPQVRQRLAPVWFSMKLAVVSVSI